MYMYVQYCTMHLIVCYLGLLEQVHGLEFFGHPIFLRTHVAEIKLQKCVVHNIW